ncbi:MAG: helix-turn-helix transcriptional regulator [Oscillospiraceae bacterium]|nr:helix-turn-helix domain-containing protein [Oscillospiraceae bacterium]MDY2862960.1 helix-turn-helix transcriptional regulator [Oscillospiraceae bacterium]
MNVELIRTLAKQKGVSITKLEEILGFGNGTIGKWVKQSPSCDKLSAVADYLSVSIDYLYYGKEKSSSSELSDEEQKCIDLFSQLDTLDKGRILERMDCMIENYTPEMKENA